MSILVSWYGTGVAPVLMHWSCCSLVLGHQCECLSCSVHLLSSSHFYADGLAWNCGSSSADALELLQSCAGPYVREHGLLYAPSIMLSFSCWWLGIELWWLQCWHTGIAAVLRWAIKMSSQFDESSLGTSTPNNGDIYRVDPFHVVIYGFSGQNHNAVQNWFHKNIMMTSSNRNIFRFTGHLCGEFTGPHKG